MGTVCGSISSRCLLRNDLTNTELLNPTADLDSYCSDASAVFANKKAKRSEGFQQGTKRRGGGRKPERVDEDAENDFR
jgi:hypothetical protein